MLLEADDPEMEAALPKREEKQLTERKENVEREIEVFCCCRRTRTTRKNVIVEIRAWAPAATKPRCLRGELFRMLFALRGSRSGGKWKSWRVRRVRLGGLKEVVASIQGQKVYSKLKYESGVHRVQRVPAHRAARPHSHLGGDGRGAARGRRHRHQNRSEGTCASIRFCSSGPGGQVGEHDVFGRAHHAHSFGPGRLTAGRKITDQESRQGRCAVLRAPPL